MTEVVVDPDLPLTRGCERCDKPNSEWAVYECEPMRMPRSVLKNGRKLEVGGGRNAGINLNEWCERAWLCFVVHSL